MKTALFLGAGASRAFGYPVTGSLLPGLLRRLASKELFDGTNTAEENQEDRDWFGERLYSFLPGLADAYAAFTPESPMGVSVTDLLTQIDRAIQHGESRATMSPEDLTRFRALAERAIYETLLHENESRQKYAADALDQFREWLQAHPNTAIVTTNYDTTVERCVFDIVRAANPDNSETAIQEQIDFGFPWRTVDPGNLIPRPRTPKWRIFKLHGSVNWLRCSLCGQIYLNTAGAVGSKAFKRKLDQWNTCHCNNWARLRLHLVTPSLLRQTNDAHLLGIWQAALETFRTAEEWVIVGYSLPAEDVAIRSLFLRAWDGHQTDLQGGRTHPRVSVIQRKDPATNRVYKAFFPKSHLTYSEDGFEAYLSSSK